ncbi:hypothetical protein PG985_013542 [Apiospora marii]|uniref:uncharacterized protein n=1 Tax=Apiospora marii TaxID=335849 RepID=UPI00312D685C
MTLIPTYEFPSNVYRHGSYNSDLVHFETYPSVVRRTYLRELILILPDPLRRVDACNASIPRLIEVLSSWDHPTGADIHLEIFLLDKHGFVHIHHSSCPLLAGRDFSRASADPLRSLRPGPIPFPLVVVFKGLLFGRGRQAMMPAGARLPDVHRGDDKAN